MAYRLAGTVSSFQNFALPNFLARSGLSQTTRRLEGMAFGAPVNQGKVKLSQCAASQVMKKRNSSWPDDLAIENWHRTTPPQHSFTCRYKLPSSFVKLMVEK